jgi:putative membrane protein
MIGFLLRAAISALALWVADELFEGMRFESASQLIVSAIVLGIVNGLVRPLAFLLTFPITVLTLGLFLLVLNAGMLALVALIVPGFGLAGFWTAVGAALIVSLVSWFASSVIGSNGRTEVFVQRRR